MDFFTHTSKKRFKSTHEKYLAFCNRLEELKTIPEYQPLAIGKLCVRELVRLRGGERLTPEIENDIQDGISEFIEQNIYKTPAPISANIPTERMKVEAFIESREIFVSKENAIPSLAIYFADLFYKYFLKDIPPSSQSNRGKPHIFIAIEDTVKDLPQRTLDFHQALVATQDKKKTPALFVKNPAVVGSDQYLETVEKLSPAKALANFCNLPDKCFSFLDETFLLELTDKARNEHMWICAGTGHGKTQLMQNMIFNDLLRAKDEGIGLCVMNGKGEMIDNILKSKALADVRERVVLIDPSDINYPIAINPLRLTGDTANMSPVDKIAARQFSIDLLGYIFSSLFVRRLTTKQKSLLSFCINLLQDVPEASFDSLRELIKDPTPFSDYIDKADPIVKEYFLYEFPKKMNHHTRDELSSRLFDIVNNSVLYNMLSAKENKIDFFEGIRDGKIFLINTSIDLMGEFHGLFGRIFIALILASSYRLKAIPKHQRKMFFFYADEAQDYLDHKTETLLDQVREFNIGMTFAHQRLDQLSDGLLSAFDGCTSIKAFAKLGVKDERKAAEAVRVHPDLIFNLKSEDRVGAEYVFKTPSVKNGVKVFVPFGVLEESIKAPRGTRDFIVKNTRINYSASAIAKLKKNSVKPQSKSARKSTLKKPNKPAI